MNDLDERIRQRAYDIWQREGCPDGRQEEHWARAREEVMAEGNDADAAAAPEGMPSAGSAAGTSSAPARRGRGRTSAAAEASGAKAAASGAAAGAEEGDAAPKSAGRGRGRSVMAQTEAAPTVQGEETAPARRSPRTGRKSEA